MGAAVPDHATVMIGYVLAVEDLWALGRFADVNGSSRRASPTPGSATSGSTWNTCRPIGSACLRCAATGRREDGLAALQGEQAGAETAAERYSLPALAQLLVRRGADDAGSAVDRAYDLAVRSDSLLALVPAAAARIEHAWLTGRPELARQPAELLRGRLTEAGAERGRAELLRLLRRLGELVDPFPGCPEEYAAGLRGDWSVAAAEWERVGDPYARALELADSGEVEPTLEALRVLDGLGARPAAAVVRKRLRDLGVTAVPRGPQSTTRTNPAGLTDRQAEILRLVARGLTNGEIAARLVVSVRTVDHHVSAVLQKLGVASRRDAAAAAGRLGLE